jgi:GNAT superfamily N-acetyltransferase
VREASAFGYRRARRIDLTPPAFKRRYPEGRLQRQGTGARTATRRRGAGPTSQPLHQQGNSAPIGARKLGEACLQDDRPRVASAEDVALIGATVTLAFAADPFARWVWPDAARYRDVMPEASAAFAGGDLVSGSAIVVRHGAALFLPPGIEPDGDRLVALCMEHTPNERLEDLAAIYDRLGSLRPDEPHWYLTQLAVDPIAQGRGIGDALLRHVLARCDEAGQPAFLETGNPRNHGLYRRHGFEPVGTVQMGSAPPMTAMLHAARQL